MDTAHLYVTPSTTGEHYKSTIKGQKYDLISHWQHTNSAEVARAKQIAQIERYCARYGKKDSTLQEASKMLDYISRLVEWELELDSNE